LVKLNLRLALLIKRGVSSSSKNLIDINPKGFIDLIFALKKPFVTGKLLLFNALEFFYFGTMNVLDFPA
jgi:hypothetical protein